MRLPRILLMVASSTLAALAVEASPPSSFLPGTEITSTSVVEAMNYYRAIHGGKPLRIDPRLSDAAEDRMRDMEDLGYFAHDAPDGRSPFLWMTIHGYTHALAGENLARGFETTQILVSSWMESRGHRRNILDERFEDVGIAIIDGSPLGREGGRSIVVLFARERGK